MNYVRDDDGLHDPAAREAMRGFAGDGLSLFEAAAAVRSAAHAIDRLRAAGAEGRALSSGAVDLLLRLDREPAGVGELARAAGVSSRNVTGLVDTLENAGMVTRTPDPRDRRAVLVSITDAGVAWLDGFREPARLAMAAVFHGFSAEDVARLRDLCLRLVLNQRAVAVRTGDPTPSTVD